MRTLKFRAWSTTHKKMYDRVLAGPGDPCSIVHDGKGWVQFDEVCGKIMQFTGIFDKNGKEIYEGDILLVEGRSIEMIDYGVACFRIVSSNGFKMALEDISHLQIEVIGNVYETPDMIKQAE